ncbi:MAG TPA: cadherin repeat domain-containing protein [Thermoanaerobaculia bacterium]|nr:cadherin repeat domain-containing protein [Thermoanaerobaculia bacterium]
MLTFATAGSQETVVVRNSAAILNDIVAFSTGSGLNFKSRRQSVDSMRGHEHQPRRAHIWAHTAAGCCALLLTLAAHADPFVRPVVSGRQLLIGGVPFELRSFAYSPVPIGENPAASTSTRYTDARLIRRDGPLMTAAGANGIRIFDAMTIKSDGTGEVHTNLAFIREAALQGLWVVMGTGFPCDLDFANATIRNNVVQAHVNLAAQFGAEPNVLMWAPGNEMNLAIAHSHFADWYSLLEAISSAVKTAQGPGGPLLCGDNGDVSSVDDACPTSVFSNGGATAGMTLAPSVDVWAVNLFRGASLGTLREELLAAPAKPYWIAEMGIDSFNNTLQVQDEASQAAVLKALWDQIRVFDDVLFGADLGFWSDEWWKCGAPTVQDNCGNPFGNGPDNFINEEHLGAMRIAAGAQGEVNQVIPKQAYTASQTAWADACPNALGPEPFLADFDAGTSNNYAGFSFGQQNGIGVTSGNTAAGASGAANDFALRVAQASVPGATPYIIAVLTLFPPSTNTGYDFSSFDTLSFDIRKGTSTAFGSWLVRLEDSSDPPNEFMNDSVALSALTTSFQHIQIPLTSFTAPSKPVDLTRLAQIVFAAVLPGSRPSSLEIDFILDNVRIYSSSAPASCNRTPTGIALSPSSLVEGTPNSTVVGAFSTTDPDAADSHTYTLVNDPSNGGFGLSSANLVVANTSLLTAAQSPYLLSVRSADNGSPSLAVERFVSVQVCAYQISPVGTNVSSASGSGSIQVTATTSCSWTAAAPAGSFVTISSGSSGTGSGTVQYSFTPNGSGSLRSTTLTIAGKSFTLSQNSSGVSMSLAATASSSQVALSWSAASGATSYSVMRSANNSAFSSVITTSNLFYTDASVVNGTGYRYEILALANGPVSMGYSNIELVVPFAWTDPSLTAGTIVKAAHLAELRSAVNAARATLGWQPLTFNGTIAGGQTVGRNHLVDLRSAVDAVRAGAGEASASYSDPTVTVNVTPIRAPHILDLRAALQ